MGRSHGFNWTAEKRDRVRALRASGLMYYEIAKQLSVEWGIHLTESQCKCSVARKAPPARLQSQPQETKPTVEVLANLGFEPPTPKVPAVHTISKSSAGNFLTIPDPGYRELLQAPEGWRWADSWTIDGGKSRFMLEHGHNGPQGFGGLRLRPLQNGLNTIWGHQHANAGIAHVVTSGQQVYGMCVGSLIDVESYAFEYDKANQYKPWIGVGVILNGGTTPLLVPYEREAA